MESCQVVVVIAAMAVVLLVLGVIGSRQARAKGHVPRGALSSGRVIRERKQNLKAARRVGGSQAVVHSWVRADPSDTLPPND